MSELQKNFINRTPNSPPPTRDSTLIEELVFDVNPLIRVTMKTYILDSPLLVNPNVGRAKVTHLTETFIENEKGDLVRSGSMCSAKDEFDLKKGEVKAFTRALEHLTLCGLSKQQRSEGWAAYHRARSVADEYMFIKCLLKFGIMSVDQIVRELAELRVNDAR